MSVFILGAAIVMVTGLVMVTLMIFYKFEDGPPPDWVMYPLPVGLALMIIGVLFT